MVRDRVGRFYVYTVVARGLYKEKCPWGLKCKIRGGEVYIQVRPPSSVVVCLSLSLYYIIADVP